MSLLHIYVRNEMRSSLESLFRYVDAHEYMNAEVVAHQWQSMILTYYDSRGIDCQIFYDLFDNLYHGLRVYTNNNFKTELLRKDIREILSHLHVAIKDPLHHLKSIYEDIRHYYLDLSRQNVGVIIDCFDELSDLTDGMRNIGGKQWVNFCIALQKIGACEASLMRVNKAEKVSGVILDEIDKNFTQFFSAIHRVLASLEMDKKEISAAYTQGIDVPDLADALGQRDEDIRELVRQTSAEEESSRVG